METLKCKNCMPPERHPGCHETCEVYLAWKKEKAKEKAKKKERQWLDNLHWRNH